MGRENNAWRAKGGECAIRVANSLAVESGACARGVIAHVVCYCSRERGITWVVLGRCDGGGRTALALLLLWGRGEEQTRNRRHRGEY
jgi:hypothetical protein